MNDFYQEIDAQMAGKYQPITVMPIFPVSTDNQIVPLSMPNTIRMLTLFIKKLGGKHKVSIDIISEEIPVTVQEWDGEVLAYCNHANSYATKVPFDGSDNPVMVWTTVCDKCPRVRNDEGEWV